MGQLPFFIPELTLGTLWSINPGMGERIKPLEDFSRKVDRVRAFIFGEDDPSEDLEMFLASGHIEKLVRQGRTPFKTGRIGTFGENDQVSWKEYYQVPPKGFNPEDIDHIFDSNGSFIFVHKTGFTRHGSTYSLTEEQAKGVEDRIKAEKQRINQESKSQIK